MYTVVYPEISHRDKLRMIKTLVDTPGIDLEVVKQETIRVRDIINLPYTAKAVRESELKKLIFKTH